MSWPYDEDIPPYPPNLPLWECPSGQCQCHATKAETDLFEVSIRLFSADGEPMKDARCRVLHHGRLLNPDEPQADEAGWITVLVPSAPTTLLVEWAPPDTPIKPDLPHRLWYYVDVDRPGDAPTRRRLHNLGFSGHRSLEANVKAFQREYGYESADGSPASIQDSLITYHDEGRVPLRAWGTAASEAPADTAAPVEQASGDGSPDVALTRTSAHGAITSRDVLFLRAGPGGAAQAGGGGGAPPAARPPAPPTKGKPALASGSARPARVLPSIVTAFKAGQTCGEWFRLHIVKGSLEGYFWILGDALLWNVPEKDEAWKWWDESYCPTTQTPHFGKVVNRRRLCRLPCTAYEANTVAGLLTTKRSILKGIKGSNSVDISPEDGDLGSDDAAIGSVLPTTLLYDTLYLQADIQIGFQAVIGFGTKHVPPVHKMVNDYAKKVNLAAIAAVNKSSKSTMPRALGTPGKIWAIHPDMERYQWSKTENRVLICAINHGFHEPPPNPTAKAHQNAGSAHGRDHDNDYSQIFSTVAGYCAVRASSSDPFRWRKTADIYTSTAAPSFAPLVSKSGKPLPRSAYGGGAQDPQNKPLREKHIAFIPEP